MSGEGKTLWGERVVLTCGQGTKEWLDARLGIPTASRFSDVVTPTGALSKSDKYRNELLAEWAMQGSDGPEYTSGAMDRGYMLQPEALDWYAFKSGAKYREVGLVYGSPDRLVACSPDALVGKDGGVEVKCHLGKQHIAYWVGDPLEEIRRLHWPQVQGSLLVTGAKWWDVVLYHPSPRLRSKIIRVSRDEEYIETLSAALETFVGALLACRDYLVTQGVGND